MSRTPIRGGDPDPRADGPRPHDPQTVLSTTRRRTDSVGCDLGGSTSPIGWTFALPCRTTERTVEVADAPTGTLGALPGDHTVAADLPSLRAATAGSIDVIDLSGLDPANGSTVPFDEIACAAASALSTDGVVRADPRWVAPLAAAGLHPSLQAWVSPADDPVAVVPFDDPATIDTFRRNGRHSPGFAHVLGRQSSDPAAATMVLFGHDPDPTAGPPSWLVEIAEDGGVDIADHRWGLWARRDFESQKAVMFLHGRGRSADEPEFVVKVPRSPEYNHRLLNEAEAIARVSTWPELAPTVPATMFSGWHAGLFVLGSRGIAGPSMPAVTANDEASNAHDLPGRVIDWIELLGAETARTGGHDDLPVALSEVVGRFASMCAPPAELVTFLHQQVDLVADSRDPIPPVVMHGNVTDWNVIVPPTGPLIMVDWEFSEPLAPPLWDLFHFLRMNAWRPTRGWRRRIPRWPARTDTFLSTRSIGDGVVASSIERYCNRVGVPGEVVAPLFHLCWAHLCLNEATHRTTDRLASGPFASVLRRSVALDRAGRLGGHFGACHVDA